MENCNMENIGANDTSSIDTISLTNSNLTLMNSSLSDSYCYNYNNVIYAYNHSNLNIINSRIYNIWGNESSTLHARYYSNLNFINSTYGDGTGEDSDFIYGTIFSNITIINSNFTNHEGYFILSGGSPYVSNGCNVLVNNSSFNNSNQSAIYVSCRFNLTINNSIFSNCSGYSGTIDFNGDELLVNNCSFINNYGIYGGDINVNQMDPRNQSQSNILIVNNSRFINSTSLMSGGSISITNYTSTINNCLFENCTTGIYGGAIIGSTNFTNITNSIFRNNHANNTGHDIYYYAGDLSFENNTLDYDEVINLTRLNNHVVVDTYYYGDYFYSFNNNYSGYCLEERSHNPDHNEYFIHFNDTSVVINYLNNKTVSNYVKYILYTYGRDDFNNTLNYYERITFINHLIWFFTSHEYNYSNVLDAYGKYFVEDYDFWYYSFTEKDLNLFYKIINETIKAVDSGVRIPDHGATKILNNSKILVYDFATEFSNGYQNFITYRTYTIENGTNDYNVSKISNNPYVIKGNDLSFDILVSNNGTLMIGNITVVEDDFEDLVYKSYSSNLDWNFSIEDGKPTWRLLGFIGINQTAYIHVVFSTNNVTAGNKTNTAIVFYKNNNKTSNNTTDIESYSFNVVKETLTPVVYKGNITSFRIIVTNDGTLDLTNITVRENSFGDLVYKSWSPVNGSWVYNGDLSWTLNHLSPGESVSFDVDFNTYDSKVGYKTNFITVSTNETGIKNATNKTKVIENETSHTINITKQSINSKKNITANEYLNEKKSDVKTIENTGVPIIGFILALFAIISLGFRNDKR